MNRFCKVELDLQFHYGIRACRIQGSHTYRFTHQAQRVLLGVTTDSRTKAQRVLGVTWGVLGKTHVPHQIDKTLDKSLYRGGNPQLKN